VKHISAYLVDGLICLHLFYKFLDIRLLALFTEESELSGSINLLDFYGLESAYHKMSMTKRPKEELSSFLPNLPGFLDTPASDDKSSLRDLFENPHRVRKEIEALPPQLFNGFRLKPGPVIKEFF
jgi:mediator of RNA polymerase II transcription subunit 19